MDVFGAGAAAGVGARGAAAGAGAAEPPAIPIVVDAAVNVATCAALPPFCFAAFASMEVMIFWITSGASLVEGGVEERGWG